MINYNIDCPYCHDIFDQYCNLFKGYKNCDKVDCEVLKILKENERLEKENKKFLELFIFKKGKCVGKSKISVKPIAHYYGKDEWNGYEYYKYSCPICNSLGCKHQVTKKEPNCPICGINLEWELADD